ncbi:hypothetical protein [Sphingorhabdus sp.]|jgi:hypothetical protein|uniref:hypothetical protein n=1 Tax=Sphingorhabdus sp. TaxID=1902408 RepID=UPI003BAE2D4C|nr:hypothetical protein [Sphingomonadales bacterium]
MDDSPFPPRTLFRPVVMKRRRHDGWTVAKQDMFLHYLGELGMVTAATRAVGMSPKSAYALYDRSLAEQGTCADDTDESPSFAEAWNRAVEMGRDKACALAITHAPKGEVRPIFYRGVQVGERIVYNNALVYRAVQLVLRDRNKAERAAQKGSTP